LTNDNRSVLRFEKAFTQQEPIPEAGIERAVEIMRTGRLHRYNVIDDEVAEAALLETDFATYVGRKYCLACASGGYAMHVALKAANITAGEPVLTNAFTLAPVPGAIHNAGGRSVLVEIDENYCVDLDHLETMMKGTGARFFMISHMRGHIADMDAVVALCDRYGVMLIEDCAHTMGAYWKGRKSGTHGAIACYSTQTYKHLNSGEGGLLVTDDAQVMARAIVHSGSYMLFERHGNAPESSVFEDIKLDTPNYSGRMDNLRAAILRAQLGQLDENCRRWNERYQALERTLRVHSDIALADRPSEEVYVGSSLQFRVPTLSANGVDGFVRRCADRGVELKWFGGREPHGFTSRYDSWRYLESNQHLPQTLNILATTFDLRLPLTFTPEDMEVIGAIICDEVDAIAVNSGKERGRKTATQ
jgi:dTDP-4-amino-4,6-dideoxygalactose transaminase